MKFKSIFLLFIFLFLKLEILHSISHVFSDNHTDDCEQCVLIAEANETQTFKIFVNTYTNNNFKVKKFANPYVLLYKNPTIVKENQRNYFFNKPPPLL
jgi:hypothetical protein